MVEPTLIAWLYNGELGASGTRMTCLFIDWAFEGSLPACSMNINAQHSTAEVNAIKRFTAIDYVDDARNPGRTPGFLRDPSTTVQSAIAAGDFDNDASNLRCAGRSVGSRAPSGC